MRSLLCAFFAAAILAGCGGGGSSSPDPSTGETLAVTLVDTGVAFRTSTPPASNRVIITSSMQLTALAAGRFVVPASLANFDYSRGSVIYVEGAGDSDFTSVARVGQVRRLSGVDSVTAEICRSVNPIAGFHKPYALYTTATPLNPDAGTGTSFGFFPCPSVSLLPATFISGGLAPITDLSPRPPTVIRDQVVWDNTKSKLPAGSIPPQYATPDFSQVVLIYVETLRDGDPNLYVRMMGVYGNIDGSHDVVAEQCGVIIDFEPLQMYNHYAVYSVPRFTGDARLAKVALAPPSCLTVR